MKVTSQVKPWEKVWPPHVSGTFEITKPLPEIFRLVAEDNPARVAVNYYGRDISYGELNGLIDRCAQALIRLGLNKGDRVALFMQNCPQFIIAYFGTLRAGGVVVPLNPMFKQAELRQELQDAGCRVLVSSDTLYPEAAKVREESSLEHVLITSLGDYCSPGATLIPPAEVLSPKQVFPHTEDFNRLLEEAEPLPTNRVDDIREDLALLQYTGGTTGLPKGAMITHYALAYSVVAANNWFQHREEDVFLGVTPYFHIMGMVMSMCAPLLAGGRIVVMSRFSPGDVARAVTEHRVTAWVGATTMLVALLQLPDIHSYDLSTFRYILCGGSSFGPELKKKVQELAPRAFIMEGYGLTESVAHGGVITPPGAHKPGFVGVPHGNTVRVVDLETGEKELPANQEGEIVIKGPITFRGYWRRPKETEEVLRDGWVHTGDVGLMDEEGYVKILGRNRELIKCSGFSVFPVDVEDLLYRHPAVGEVAVIGVPDPYRGESPKAFVVLKQEFAGRITEQEIIDWAKENMSAYKRPREVEFCRELPKSGAGKILRRVLVERERSRRQRSMQTG
ncbi:MAG: AMP-binding protein [Peptococcaceae bacterium]|nr:AMP-binding protein [Peptococcaceae bacterium]